MEAKTSLHILAAEDSPEIIISPKDKVFLMRGRSFPEDCAEVFEPLISWIRTNHHLIAPGFTFEVTLDYISSTSVVYLARTFNQFKEHFGANFKITWNCHPEDVDIIELGKRYKHRIGDNFSIVLRKEH